MTDPKTLTILQQTLKGVTLGLAASSRVNLAELAMLLQSFTVSADLEEESRQILLDLAQGLDYLAQATGQKEN